MAMSLLDAQRKLNEILINVEGVADVLEGLADKDGGKRDGPWNTYIMLRNLLNATAAETIEKGRTMRLATGGARGRFDMTLPKQR
jgi:hypothetical protein